ncbi:MAG: antitoxin VbhA family protein [Limnochordia bacterium]
MTLQRQEKSLRFAEANLRFEGFVVPPAVKRDCRKLLRGEVTSEQLVAKYLAAVNKE